MRGPPQSLASKSSLVRVGYRTPRCEHAPSPGLHLETLNSVTPIASLIHPDRPRAASWSETAARPVPAMSSMTWTLGCGRTGVKGSMTFFWGPVRRLPWPSRLLLRTEAPRSLGRGRERRLSTPTKVVVRARSTSPEAGKPRHLGTHRGTSVQPQTIPRAARSPGVLSDALASVIVWDFSGRVKYELRSTFRRTPPRKHRNRPALALRQARLGGRISKGGQPMDSSGISGCCAVVASPDCAP